MNELGGRVVLADVMSEFLEVAIHLILFVRGIYPPELFESTQKYGCPLKTARHPGLVSYIQQIVRSIRMELHKVDPTGKAIDRFVFEMSMLRAFDDSILDQITDHGSKSTYYQSQNDTSSDGDLKGKGRVIEGPGDLNRPMSDKERTDSHKEYYGNGVDTGNDADDEPLYPNPSRGKANMQKEQHNHYHNSESAREAPRFGGSIALTTDVQWMLRAMLLKISVCDSYLKPLADDCSFTVVIEMKAAGSGPDAKPNFPWAPISAAATTERSKLSASAAQPSPDRKIIPVKTIDIADIQVELYIEEFSSPQN
ncbi:MAD2 mitotic arrest deficient-like 2 [Gamsiella multidivaricata]|nr:MAD2 mitotic arrest deficient-like 2 [Gamsiella multidivaricata]